LRCTDFGTAQTAKVAPFAGGNQADVRKSAAGDFFQWTRAGISLTRTLSELLCPDAQAYAQIA
jgi:hypothetical protein